MSIILPSSSLLESAANSSIASAVAEGWRSLLGTEKVTRVSIRSGGAPIIHSRPKLVMLVGSYLPSSSYYSEITTACREVGAISVFWATEDPYEIDANYRVDGIFDVVCTCERGAVRRYKKSKAVHLPLAALASETHREIDWKQKDIDVFFCGIAFKNRLELLTPITPFLNGLKTKVFGPGWGDLGPAFSDARISREELISYYARSKITLNLGRSLHFENKGQIVFSSTPGPRTFEAAMAGTAQLFHEDTTEMSEYFDRTEILPFSSAAELETAIRKLLSLPDETIDIASRAQQRVLAEHTYERRLMHLLDALNEMGFAHDCL